MTTITLSTGERVPPLADTAVVHEDGDWRLMRTHYAGVTEYCLREQQGAYIGNMGAAFYAPGSRKWMAFQNVNHYVPFQVYYGTDLDQALAALWAARGA